MKIIIWSESFLVCVGIWILFRLSAIALKPYLLNRFNEISQTPLMNDLNVQFTPKAYHEQQPGPLLYSNHPDLKVDPS